MMDVRDRNSYSRIRKGCVDAVNGDRIERVCGVTADINNDRQPAILACALELLRRYEGRNRRRKVNAVDKDVNVEDFLEWAALCRLVKVPLEDVVPTGQGQLRGNANFVTRPTPLDRFCGTDLLLLGHIFPVHQSPMP